MDNESIKALPIRKSKSAEPVSQREETIEILKVVEKLSKDLDDGVYGKTYAGEFD